MASPTVANIAIKRVDLALSTEQLNNIAINGQREAAAGNIYGDQLYNPHENVKLNNATVHVLNTLIGNLHANPIDATIIDGIINGTIDATPMQQRFGDIFFQLALSQIYVQNGKNGTPTNAYSIGYPLRDALEKLQQHKIHEREYVGSQVWNGQFIEGSLAGQNLPVYDFMFDEDSDITDCFWYIVKMICMVI